MKTTRQDIIITRSRKDEPSPNTAQSAAKRQATLNEQIDEFFSAGGEIEKLPPYDDIGNAGQAIYGRKAAR